MTDKERLLDLLRKNANSRGRVYLSALKIRRTLGVSSHDLTKNLFDLQSEHLVDLTIKRGGQKHVRVMAIRLRPAAMVRDTAPEPTERPEEPVEGGPGIQAPPATGTPAPAVSVQEITAVVPLPQQVLDDAQFMDMRRAPFTAEHYPMIHELLARVATRSKVEEAARALEAAGLDDLALSALDAIPDFTPLEQEMLAVVNVFRTPEWDEPGPSVRETITGLVGDSTFDEH